MIKPVVFTVFSDNGKNQNDFVSVFFKISADLQ